MIRPVWRVGNEKSGNVRNDGSKCHDRNYFNHDSGRNKGNNIADDDVVLKCRLFGRWWGGKRHVSSDGILCGRSGMRRRSLITMVSRIKELAFAIHVIMLTSESGS